MWLRPIVAGPIKQIISGKCFNNELDLLCSGPFALPFIRGVLTRAMDISFAATG